MTPLDHLKRLRDRHKAALPFVEEDVAAVAVAIERVMTGECRTLEEGLGLCRDWLKRHQIKERTAIVRELAGTILPRERAEFARNFARDLSVYERGTFRADRRAGRPSGRHELHYKFLIANGGKAPPFNTLNAWLAAI